MHPKKLSVHDVPVAAARGLARRAVSASVLLSVLLMGTASATTVADITTLMRNGKQAEAMTQLDAALKKDPQDPQLRFARGVIFTEQKRTQEAIAIFLKLSEEYPNLPEPYNNLAVLYSQDNQYDKARAALNMAIKTNASYATAYENLGDVHARMAAQAYDKALNLNSDVAVKSKLAILRTLDIPVSPKVATATPPASSVVTSSVPTPVSTPTTGHPVAANTVIATSAADLDKRPAADKAAVASAIAAARQASAVQAAAPVAVAQANNTPAVPKTPVATPNQIAVAAAPAVATPAPVVVTSKPAQAPVVAKAAPAPTEQETVLAAITTWSRAWSGRDMDAYLSAYDANFKGAAKTHAAWAAERKARIVSKSSIQVSIDKPSVEVHGDTATANFRQIYVGGAVHSDGMKTLNFKKVGGKWQITNETSTS